MKYQALLLSILASFFSCNSKENIDSQTIKIDLSSFSIITKEVSDNDMTFIPLIMPDSIFFGNINHMKEYGDFIFLHDENQTKSLTIVNHSGQVVNQLKQLGDGPGEYRALSAFAFAEEDSILTIYDRLKRSLSHYKFPELKHISTVRINKYLMNIEYINKDTLVVTSEDYLGDNGDYEGMLYVLRNGTQITDDLGIGRSEGSIELSFPNTVIKTSNGTFYAHPDEFTTIYKLSSVVEAIYVIDFDKNIVPKEAWSLIEGNDFMEFVEENNKAIWVQNMILSNDNLAFSFLYKDLDTRYFYNHDHQDSSLNVYSGYTVNKSDYILPHPVGSDGKSFLSLIYTESIDPTRFENNNEFLKAYQKSEENGGYLILKYKP